MATTHIPNFGEGAHVDTRDAGDVQIVDVTGRLTIGPALIQLADTVNELLNAGCRKILLNLAGVTHIDSSGMGELNATLKVVSGTGGSLKLLQVSRRIQDLMRMVGVHSLFTFEQQETEALSHF